MQDFAQDSRRPDGKLDEEQTTHIRMPETDGTAEGGDEFHAPHSVYNWASSTGGNTWATEAVGQRGATVQTVSGVKTFGLNLDDYRSVLKLDERESDQGLRK